LGPRRVRGLADALDVVDEPLPLQILVEVAGTIGEKSLIYRLKSVIERVAPRPEAGGTSRFDTMQRVRAKAHLELARIGSRVAIADLQSILADADRRIGQREVGRCALPPRCACVAHLRDQARGRPRLDGRIEPAEYSAHRKTLFAECQR